MSSFFLYTTICISFSFYSFLNTINQIQSSFAKRFLVKRYKPKAATIVEHRTNHPNFSKEQTHQKGEDATIRRDFEIWQKHPPSHSLPS